MYQCEIPLKVKKVNKFSYGPAFAQYSGVLLGNIVLGHVADKWGRRKTFIFSLLIGIPALCLSATFDSLPLFFAFRALTGVGIAGVSRNPIIQMR